MPGFFDWLRGVLRGRRKPTPQPESVEEYEIYEEGPEDIDIEEQAMPSQYAAEEEAEPAVEGCEILYLPGRSEGRTIRVIPRYYVDNPNIDCIRDLITAAGDKSFYTFIVCGSPHEDYPEKEGESNICLGIRTSRMDVYGAAYGPRSATALDFANILFDEPGTAPVQWDSLDSVAILDRP